MRTNTPNLEKILQTITATDLARSTREVLDRVVVQGKTIAIERNHTLIAQLMPPQKTMTARQTLAGLSIPKLTPAQGTAWLRDSKAGIEDAVRDPWA